MDRKEHAVYKENAFAVTYRHGPLMPAKPSWDDFSDGGGERWWQLTKSHLSENRERKLHFARVVE